MKSVYSNKEGGPSLHPVVIQLIQWKYNYTSSVFIVSALARRKNTFINRCHYRIIPAGLSTGICLQCFWRKRSCLKTILPNYNVQSGGNGSSTYFFRKNRVKACIFPIPSSPLSAHIGGWKDRYCFHPVRKALESVTSGHQFNSRAERNTSFFWKKGILYEFTSSKSSAYPPGGMQENGSDIHAEKELVPPKKWTTIICPATHTTRFSPTRKGTIS